MKRPEFRTKSIGEIINVEKISGERLNEIILFVKENNGKVLAADDPMTVRVVYNGTKDGREIFYKKVNEMVTT